jgi:branched-chain amino acid transport system ATP-binding protein
MPLLSVENMTGGWGPTTIVENVSFTLERGDVISIIGRNGAGKTTTLELLIGRARLHGGVIRLDGHAVHEKPIYERNRAGIGHVPQGREVFPSLTVRENLSAAARHGAWTMERLLDLFPSLGERINSPGGLLSGGEQQMLSIARALIGNPSVLLLDEPTEGLAPIVVEELVEAIKKLTAAKELAVVLVEQIVDVALDLSDLCLVLERGHIIHRVASADFRRNPDMVQSLLGFA